MKQKKHGFIHIFVRPWHYETALTAKNNNRINSHFFHNLASINLNNINQNFLRLPFLSFVFDRFFGCLYIDLIKNCLRGEILTKFGLRPKLKFICINLPVFFSDELYTNTCISDQKSIVWSFGSVPENSYSTS